MEGSPFAAQQNVEAPDRSNSIFSTGESKANVLGPFRQILVQFQQIKDTSRKLIC
jgi:hypothetical protein